MNITQNEYYEEYKQHLRIKNKIVCSYSRELEFTDAVEVVQAAKQYTVIAHTWCAHNTIYVFDEEGFMTTYILVDETKES